MSGEFDSFLVAVSDELPAGVDLEYDPEFARMEKAAKGTPDQAFGNTVIEAQPPDWDTVRDAAMQLLARTKDLRVAVYLAQAELYGKGIDEFREVLKIIDVFVNEFWDSVFPQLDHDDDDDPTIRINALMGLNEVGGLIRQLHSTPILRSRSVGLFSLLHVAVAKGEAPLPPEWDAAPTLKQIDAAVHTCDPNQLQRAYQATLDCLQHTASIEKAFSDRLGMGTGPNFEALNKELKSIARQQKAWVDELLKSQPAAQAPSVDGSNALTTLGSPNPTSVHQDSQQLTSGPLQINCREDVVDALDRIIRWLERYEPSSPLPMLLRRAKRLSNMSFLEILRDISPGGIDQALLIGGQDADDEPLSARPAEQSAAASGNDAKQRSASVAASNDDY